MSAAGEATLWPWVALVLLGALHGVNPGMGWLFATALGMQRGERRAVWRALLPLTLGHALAIAAAVTLAAAAGLVVPMREMRWVVAALLVVMGVRQLRRHRHPRFGGMRVGARDLVAWSFLVATAHGAGLMSVPLAAEVGAVGAPTEAHATAAHATHAAAGAAAPNGPTVLAVAATLAHTAGYVLVTGILALVVYQWVGVGVLRRAWVNVDLLWALTLLVTAGAIVLV